MINSRQLEYFHAVARELHFTRAAQTLHMAQPALSQQIRKLECQLGVELFERDRHRVTITPAGAALLEHADRILADLHAAKLDAATLAALPAPDDGRLTSLALGEEPLVLVAGLHTSFGRRRRVPVAALDGADLALYGPGSAIRDAIVAALAAAGATPRVRFETREYATARSLAHAGLALAIMPRSVAAEP